jgi:hypothetical protein
MSAFKLFLIWMVCCGGGIVLLCCSEKIGDFTLKFERLVRKWKEIR